VIGDPDDTLPGSLHEARIVQTLDPSFSLLTGARATRAKLLDALRDLDSLHFAGHARYQGTEGIDSSLVLADGDLSVGEILTQGPGPRHVVLSACQTARSESDGLVQSLGLVQAFVAVGAEVVIASPRPTVDSKSSAFFEVYYRVLRERPSQPLQAWREAALRRRALADPNWSVFRALIP
jgi:CHAT domain-containing protein